MEKLSFKELTNKLDFFYVENNMEKTIEEIKEECRKFIRENGFECADENSNSDSDVLELIEETHPDWNTDNFEWYCINYQPFEFLCKDECDELYFAELNIKFYGDYDKGIGVFNVTD